MSEKYERYKEKLKKERGKEGYEYSVGEKLKRIFGDIEKYGIKGYLTKEIPKRIAKKFGKDWNKKELEEEESDKVLDLIVSLFPHIHEKYLIGVGKILPEEALFKTKPPYNEFKEYKEITRKERKEENEEYKEFVWEKLEMISGNINKYGIERYLKKEIPKRIAKKFKKDWNKRELEEKELTDILNYVVSLFPHIYEKYLVDIDEIDPASASFETHPLKTVDD